ncbi:MAG: hypothetical protein P1P89_08940 [Desulfobacterales bacterium]|nr:hypothetical protein [Desulfobacterales bacterium]
MDSNGFGGSRLNKSAVVYTDDPAKPRQTLIISGPVGEFATMIPKRVVLRGIAGQPVKGMVTIMPKEKYPFKITAAMARYGSKIHFKYEEIQHSDPKGYLLTVENLQTHRGRYADTVILKTDSPIRPEITIQVLGDIADAAQTGIPLK